ncbi:MAG: (d)CMP kinase [Patescibacteria group bacterium]|nr:(d)CMP kinase [Patescibacteria group bacterium]MCL5095553.1 (d)CMP kinase [Patescibacteria group bacterium]
MKKLLQIAIDGPVGAGKSTIAKILADKLGIIYIDTGAMYRATAFLATAQKIDLKDEKKVVALLKKAKIEFEKSRLFLNGQDISSVIRKPEMGWGASVVATLPQVRKLLVEKQKKLAKGESVVMEGRDITTRVLPLANLKIYLTADQEERAERKYKEFKNKGIEKSFGCVLEETIKRDTQDTERKTDPLKVVDDAWVLDTTNLSIPEVVSKILQRTKGMK